MKYLAIILMILLILTGCSNLGSTCTEDSECKGSCKDIFVETSHEEYPICDEGICKCGCRTSSGLPCR